MAQARVKRPVIGAIYSARDDLHVYGYSGRYGGDIRNPASYTLFDFITPLQDYVVDLYYTMDLPIDTTTAGSGLGLEVSIQNKTIYEWQSSLPYEKGYINTRMGWPGGQQIQVISKNTTQNNTQDRYAHFIGRALPNLMPQDTDKAVGGGYEWEGKRPPKGSAPISIKDLWVATQGMI